MQQEIQRWTDVIASHKSSYIYAIQILKVIFKYLIYCQVFSLKIYFHNAFYTKENETTGNSVKKERKEKKKLLPDLYYQNVFTNLMQWQRFPEQEYIAPETSLLEKVWGQLVLNLEQYCQH